MHRSFKISNKAKIYVKPESSTLHADEHIVIGDLHGNALKLIYGLIMHGFIKDMSASDYDELASIYDTGITFLSEEKILRFRYLLLRQTFSNLGFLHIIGDETSDRGKCDALMFEVFEAMKHHQVKYKINPSNHGMDFLMGYFNGNFKPVVLGEHHSNSLHNLRYLMDRGIVDKEEFCARVEELYIPNLELISYIVSPDKKGIYILSHAPIDMNVIRSLGDKLHINVNCNTIDDLMTSIDNINIKFRSILTKRSLSKYTSVKVLNDHYDNNYAPDFHDNPIEYILWNRSKKHLDVTRSVGGISGHEYNISHVHGHHYCHFADHYICLDDMFGKLNGRGNEAYYYVKTTGVSSKTANEVVAPVPDVQDEYLKTLNQFISDVYAKSQCFKRSDVAAKQAALELHNALVTARDTHYEHNKEQFKINCQQAINSSRVTLNKHRSWKGILANLTLFIGSLTIPVLLIPAMIVGIYRYAKYNKFTLYQTASAKKINALETHVKAVPAH